MKIDSLNTNYARVQDFFKDKNVKDLNFPSIINDNEIVKTNTDNIDIEFEDIIKKSIDKINTPQKILDEKISAFLNGEEELHNVMLAAEQARFVMNFTVKVRDKIIEAYQTIMRMQV